MLLSIGIFVSACSTQQSSNTNAQQELNDLRQEVNQMKSSQQAKEMEGKSFESCSSTFECRGQGNSWTYMGNSIECTFNCINGQCVTSECRSS